MVKIGIARRRVGEVDRESVRIPAVEIFWACIAAAMEGEHPRNVSTQFFKIAEDGRDLSRTNVASEARKDDVAVLTVRDVLALLAS